jgi:DNA-binding MarR family transcriptional regulator
VIDPFEDDPGYLLRRTSTVAVADFARRLEGLGLRPSEATVLNVIDANPNATQSDIGRLLDIATPNMAPLVARLQGRDLIRREAFDGRSHGLTLTTEGRALVRQIKKVVSEHRAALLANLPAAQHGAFLKSLRVIWEAIGNNASSTDNPTSTPASGRAPTRRSRAP